jgi:hypothetical protein
LKKYNTLFENEGLRHDATPNYGYWRKALLRIKKHTPEAKFIFILRHPTDRLKSRCLHNLKSRNVSFGLKKHVRYECAPAIKNGGYYEHLKNWFEQFEPYQFKFILLEDLKQDPQKEMNKLADFLGIEPWEIDFEIKNQSYRYHSLRFQYFINFLAKLNEPDYLIDDFQTFRKGHRGYRYMEKLLRNARLYNRTNKNKKISYSGKFLNQMDSYYERENKGLSDLINIDLKEKWGLDI